MGLHPEREGETLVWHYAGGEVRLDRAAGRWQRTGMAAPLPLPDGEPVLHPDLDDGDVLAVLDPPLLALPGDRLITRLAWPLILTLEVGARRVDRWRPGGRKALVGPVETGRVVPAVRPGRLEGEVVPAPWEGAVRVRLVGRSPTPVVVRQILVPEDGLDLWEGPDGLLLGDLLVDVYSPERAVARPDAPTLPGDVALVGRHGGREQAPRSMFGWSAPSARAVEFVP